MNKSFKETREVCGNWEESVGTRLRRFKWLLQQVHFNIRTKFPLIHFDEQWMTDATHLPLFWSHIYWGVAWIFNIKAWLDPKRNCIHALVTLLVDRVSLKILCLTTLLIIQTSFVVKKMKIMSWDILNFATWGTLLDFGDIMTLFYFHRMILTVIGFPLMLSQK